MKKYLIFAFALLVLASCSGKKRGARGGGGDDESIDSTSVVSSSEEKTEELKEVAQAVELSGAINDRYKIEMKLDAKGDTVEGSYYYTSDKARGELKIEGTLESDGHLVLDEYNSEGRQTGRFDGYYGKSAGYNGTFTNFRGDSYPFSLTVKDVRDLAGDGEGRGFLAELSEGVSHESDYDDGDDYEIDADSDDSYSDSDTGNNWDELLDSYDEYVDEYITLLRKAKHGDASALSEYPTYMEKAQEYANRLQNAEGNMSSSQMARYNRINAKLAKAAQSM